MENIAEKVRTDCWDSAVDAAGFNYIYAKRIANVGAWSRWCKFLGVAIPGTLGAIVGTFYAYKELMNVALVIFGLLSIFQLIISTYLITTGSDERVIEYMSKSKEYALLRGEFEQLGKYPIEEVTAYKGRLDILSERASGVGKGNFELRDSEKRMGMRFALREFNRECVSCKKIPYSMKPTECDVCGNF